ncbi:MAG: ABC transporter substrate-binding protein [Pseudorhodoplanes sp.]
MPKSEKLNRRKVLAGASALTASMALGNRYVMAADDVLYVNTWGGRWLEVEDQIFLKPFTKETGIQIKPVTPTTVAKVKAVMQSKNYEFDCSNFSAIEFIQGVLEGWYEPLDWSVLDRSKLPDSMLHPYGVATQAISMIMAYRKDKFPNGGPQSWADFWDVKKFPGARSLMNRGYTGVTFALLADGVPIDKLYPLDLNRAFKKLDQIKPHIKVFWTQGNQSEQLIRDGEVDIIGIWNARAQVLVDQGAPIQMVWNQAESTPGYWSVLKGTPRAKLAWKFIQFYSRPELQAEFAKLLGYGPSHPKAFEYLPPDVAKKMPTLPEYQKTAVRHNLDILGPHLNEISQRWTTWIAS